MRLLSAFPVLLVALALAVPATATSTRTCRSSDLRATRTTDGTTFSTAVAKLRSLGAGCTSARALALGAAKADLAGTLGTKLSGYRLAYVKPCPGCTPSFDVTARRDGVRVTFRLLPGG